MLVVSLIGACAVIGTEVRPTAGGTYREALVGQPLSLNPLLHPHDTVTQDFTRLIHAGLVRSVDGGTLVPDLATGWQSSADGLAYTFTLRPGATWHDGWPLVAEDVVATVALVQSSGFSGPAELAAEWQGVRVEALDRGRVRFTLPQARAGFIAACVLPLVPGHALGTNPGDLGEHPLSYAPIGAGPYLLRHYDADGAILVRHAGYAAHPALFDEVRLRFFPDRASAVRAFEDGAVDAVAGFQAAEAPPAGERSAFHLATVHGYQSLLLVNHGNQVLAEPAVRRALALTVDRRALAAGPLHGDAVPAYGPVAASSWAYADDLPGEPNVVLARRLLDEAGWTGAPVRSRASRPLRVRLHVQSVGTEIAVAQLLAEQWRDIGVQVEVAPTYLADFVRDRLRPADFDLALVGFWSGAAEPDPSAVWHSSQATTGLNFGRYANAPMDQLMLTSRLDGDVDRRRAALAAFQQRWQEEVPAIVLTNPLLRVVVNRQVLGYRLGTLHQPSDRWQHQAEWHMRTQRVPALPR